MNTHPDCYKSKTLKGLLTGKETLVMPDAYDPVSARIIE